MDQAIGRPVTPPASSNPVTGNQCVILFDGVCNLCTGSVAFILRRDKLARFKFASIQSPAGARFLESWGLPSEYAESILYIEAGRVYTRSDAALKITGKLSMPWPLLRAAYVIPRPIRDGLYDWIARNRYSIFGKRDSCMVPTDDVSSRFL